MIPRRGRWILTDQENKTRKLTRRTKALLLSPFVVFLILSSRLIIISNYDTPTAMTIAETSGVTNTLLGTTLPLLSHFLPLLCVILIVFRRFILTLFSVLITIAVSPAYVSPSTGWVNIVSQLQDIWVLLWNGEWLTLWHEWSSLWQGSRFTIFITILLLVAAFILSLAEYNGTLRDILPKLFKACLVLTATIVALISMQTFYRVPLEMNTMLQAIHRPWLPAERIIIKQPGEANIVRVGYTLSTGDIWHVILNENSRTITYVHSQAVLERTVCHVSDLESRRRYPIVIPKDARIAEVPRCGSPRVSGQ